MNGLKLFFATLGTYWRSFGEFLGEFVGRFVLVVFYVTLMLPWGAGVSLMSDPLDMRDKTKAPTWRERSSPEVTLEAGRGQF